MSVKSQAPRGSGSIRKKTVHSKGHDYIVWEGRISVGNDPGTGKRIQKSFTGKTQAEVRKKMAVAIADLDNGTYIEPMKITVGQWLDIWIKDYVGNLSQNTQARYKQDVEKHIKPAIGAIPMNQLKPHTVQKMYSDLSQKKGLSPKSVRNVHGVISEALKQAKNNEYIHSNPCDKCTLPRAQRKEIHPLNDAETNLFLDAIKGHDFEDLYTVTLFTGMRKGEILGLSWRDVNFNNGTICIHQQLQKEKKKNAKYYLTDTKNKKTRTITPPPTVMQILKKHRAEQAKQRLKMGRYWKDWENADLVFTDGTGRYLADSTVYKTFKRIVDSIGRPDARFHDLRHTYAVSAIRAGIDIKTISTNLGHSSVSFTLDIYGHVIAEMEKDSSDKMENYIQNLRTSS